MLALLLIIVPLLFALVLFACKEGGAKRIAVVGSFINLVIVGALLLNHNNPYLSNFQIDWISSLNASFHLQVAGLGMLMACLVALAFFLIILFSSELSYKNEQYFYGLLLFVEAGLMGVFFAHDALLFYFFWELVIIPIYFLCSIWGGEKRIQVTLNFFIYTFLGSLFLLAALLYIYSHTPDHSFAWESFTKVQLSVKEQRVIFWLLFIALAIKMPVFPFHTWQPNTYKESPLPVTMVLSGLLAKMGLFALLQWVLPVLHNFATPQLAIILCIISIIYASVIALQQGDLKKMVAYSSMAHIGLMALAIFSMNATAISGASLQMFNHGINVVALWMIIALLEKKYQTTYFTNLGGLAKTEPLLTLFFVIFMLANIGLPLTNSFVGEFLMLFGIFSFNKIIALFAGLSLILSATYSLGAIQKIFFGNLSEKNKHPLIASANARWVVGILVIFTLLILFFGIYPAPLFKILQF
ncbi:MAG: NADH-quinone oxidoreductase subunit M [Phycisphaerales bacterium]|nr:NADH-quinone oxidoreductase subunit M [Phycisphaerales bacterium]